MAIKSYKVTFPITATGIDVVDVEESEMAGKSEDQIKEILMSKIHVPIVCHQCTDMAEEFQVDYSNIGELHENVSYWEDKDDSN